MNVIKQLVNFGKCPIVEIFTSTFKHLLEITVYYCISPIVALCSIRTFTNPCQNLPKWEVFTAPSPLYVSFITLCLCNLGPHILVAYGGRLQQKKALSHQSVMSSVYNYITIYIIYIYKYICIYEQRLGFAPALQRSGFPFPIKCCCNFTFNWEIQQRY